VGSGREISVFSFYNPQRGTSFPRQKEMLPVMRPFFFPFVCLWQIETFTAKLHKNATDFLPVEVEEVGPPILAASSCIKNHLGQKCLQKLVFEKLLNC
jgi:hypothetical protein